MPKLRTDGVVVVVGGEIGADGASAKAGGLEVCVIEGGAADANFDNNEAITGFVATDRAAELRGDTLTAGLQYAVGNE